MLGATAWIALEDLLLDACPHGPGRHAVRASARSVAARLGVSKDTAAAALRRLIAVGLVCREIECHARAGVFGRSVYVIDTRRLAHAGIELRAGVAAAKPRPVMREVERQGALFESDPAVPARTGRLA